MDLYTATPSILKKLLVKRQQADCHFPRENDNLQKHIKPEKDELNFCVSSKTSQSSKQDDAFELLPPMRLDSNASSSEEETKSTCCYTQKINSSFSKNLNNNHIIKSKRKLSDWGTESDTNTSTSTPEFKPLFKPAFFKSKPQSPIKIPFNTSNSMKNETDCMETEKNEEREETKQNQQRSNSCSQYYVVNENLQGNVKSKGKSYFSHQVQPGQELNCQEILDRASKLASKRNGECLTSQCSNEFQVLSFRCEMSHEFDLSYDEALTKWCSKCQKILETLNEYLRRKDKGIVLDQFLTKKVRILCKNNHEWSSELKTIKKRDCTICKEQNRQQEKQNQEQEKQQRLKEEEGLQQKLFEEARKKFQTHYKAQKSDDNSEQNQKQNLQQIIKNHAIYDFQLTLRKYELIATEQAKEFCSKINSFDEFQNILAVYKFSLVPEECIKNFFINLDVDSVKNEFRKLAKCLHPDKNKHPDAGTVFHKVHRVYDMILKLK